MDVDRPMQEMGGGWLQGGSRTPEALAVEKFMICAVPGLAKMKETQQILVFINDECLKKDPVNFMDRVRKQCGPLLQSPQGSTPSKTWKQSQKFLETDDRQLRAW